MPISKVGNVVTYTAGANMDRAAATDVHDASSFAVCDANDPLKQIKFDASGLTTNTSVTHKVTSSSIGLYTYYDSAATAGGSATESLTFTGLAAADKVLSLFVLTKGANAASIIGTGTQSANTLSVTFSADPGANAVVRALVAKA